MADINKVEIQGRLARVDMRTSQNGKPWLNGSLAVTIQRKDGDKWVEDHTEWFGLKAFGWPAEIMEKLPKGQIVVLTGRLTQESWVDQKTDMKKEKVIIIVDHVALPLNSVRMFQVEGKDVILSRAPRTTYDNGIEKPLASGNYDMSNF